jgi:uncharacterized protein YjbI with pentapeptide repeats
MAGGPAGWTWCSHKGCIGVRLPATALCLAHTAEQAPDAFDAELERIGVEGTVDARGVLISANLLRRLMAAVPREDARPVFIDARFERATFEGEVRFSGASFRGEAGFGGATFRGGGEFELASFQSTAGFDGAAFQDIVSFDQVSFQSGAGFRGATFKGGAGFARSTFEGEAWFTAATFAGGVEFTEVTFRSGAVFALVSIQSLAMFDRASFRSWAMFTQANFQGEAVFTRTSFKHVGLFDEASFEHATQLGPLLARELVLDGAFFGARVQVEVTAATVCARRAQFPNGVHLRLRFASVVLDDADLAAPAILAGAPSSFPVLEDQEEQVTHRWQRLPPGPRALRWRPRLLSVRRTEVAGLRLADVDLRACRFAGAHNLDRLRIEGAPLFAPTAGWWRARRKTLAEEQHWRAHRPGRWRSAGWYPRACQPPASPQAETREVPDPARLAALYRDLRKGREDAKDEPGAADFYYGECEMRRHDSSTPRAERLVLWVYWLLSGYGLRAWRALAALALVVVLAGVVLAFWGFPNVAPSSRPAAVDRGGALVYQQQPAYPPPGLERLPDAIRFSARSATALLRGPDRALTPLGEWLEIGLRFVGPVLLGLAVVSVRGRVRR